MHRFGSILYVLGSEPAAGRTLARAVELARRNPARLTVATCVESAGEVDAARERLEQLVAGTPIAASTTVLVGDAASEIVREVTQGGYDLVMKVPVAEHGWFAHLRTSLDEHLLRECACTLWLDRPSELATYRRVLASVDCDNDDAPDLEPRIIETAASLAAIEDAELHVAHAWRLVGEKRMRGRTATEAAAQEVDDAVDEEEARLRRAIIALCADAGLEGEACRVHLRKGMPQVLIPELVDELGIDVLVMGTVARHGVTGLLVGNTAEAILAGVRCSLVAIKPAGFLAAAP